MGRCIVVLGAPRSGTSCVAGSLYAMGVNMGKGFLQQGNDSNPKGYFEDLRWQKINKMVTGERYGQGNHIDDGILAKYEELAAQCNEIPLWGIKDPRLCITLQYIAQYLEEYRIVVVERELEASVSSLSGHSRKNYNKKYLMGRDAARAIQLHWLKEMEARLLSFNGPVLRVHYEHVLHDPHGSVLDLSRFCFDGLSAKPDTKAAIGFIDPKLRHH